MNRRADLAVLTVVLLAAAWLRFHRLDQIPPGMTHDEGAVGYFVRQVAAGRSFAINAPFGYANEPFTKYAAAVAMRLLGVSDWTLRAHQAAWGVAAVVGAYLWARAAFGRGAGLGASALVAVSFWPVMTSRLSLNSNPAPGLFALSAGCLWSALFREDLARRWIAWAGFAVCLTGALYTYEASRGAWLSLPAFLLYLAVLGPRRRLPAFGLALAAGTALALPHLLNPAAWGRTSTLAAPLAAAAASGDLGPLFARSLQAVGTLHFRGDPFVVYNIPGRPVFDPATGLLFVAGLLVCAWRWRQPAGAFAILWLGAGFAPALPSGDFTMMLHALPTQPVALALPAIAVAAFAARWPRHARAAWLALAGLVAVTAGLTYRDYFVRWAGAPETRAAYFANFGAVTTYLRHTPYQGVVTLSSPFPGLPPDPFAADLRVRRVDLDLRWFDAREALAFPPVDESLLVLPANAPADPLFEGRLPLPGAQRHVVRKSDLDPYFDTLIWNPSAALAAWLGDGSLTWLDPPADFGGAASLVAYRPIAAQARPGQTVQVLTVWRVADPARLGPVDPINYGREAVLFVHLLDSTGGSVSYCWRTQYGVAFGVSWRSERCA